MCTLDANVKRSEQVCFLEHDAKALNATLNDVFWMFLHLKDQGLVYNTHCVEADVKKCVESTKIIQRNQPQTFQLLALLFILSGFDLIYADFTAFRVHTHPLQLPQAQILLILAWLKEY